MTLAERFWRVIRKPNWHREEPAYPRPGSGTRMKISARCPGVRSGAPFCRTHNPEAIEFIDDDGQRWSLRKYGRRKWRRV